MKKNVTTIIISVLLILSVALNVYILITSININENMDSLVAEIEELTTKAEKIDSDISNRENEMVTIETEVTTLQSEIEELEVENQDLQAEIGKAQLRKIEKQAEEVDWAGIAQEILNSTPASNVTPSEGSSTPGGGGEPIELPEGNTYHPDGILCY